MAIWREVSACSERRCSRSMRVSWRCSERIHWAKERRMVAARRARQTAKAVARLVWSIVWREGWERSQAEARPWRVFNMVGKRKFLTAAR
jgi:hypothetical protein